MCENMINMGLGANPWSLWSMSDCYCDECEPTIW